MPEELDVLRDVATRLSKANIPYMLTGSMALNFYARPRMTRDIDIVIDLREEDIVRLEKELSDVYYMDRASVRASLRVGPRMFNVIHQETVIKVDLIIRPDSAYARMAFARRRSHEFSGTQVVVIAPEDLVLSKLEWARDSHSEFQLRDVSSVLQDVENLDIAYIQHWVARLGLEALWQEAHQ